MGSATRCHFVNPKYEELHGQPCYPSLDALPERPGRRDRRAQPAAGRVGHRGRRRGRHPRRDHPGRRRRRGRRGGRGDAGARSRGSPASTAWPSSGPTAWASSTSPRTPRPTSATSRRTCRAAASPGSPSRGRSPTPSSTPARGSGSAGSSAAGRRSSSTSATTSRTASTTRRRARSSCSSRASSDPERFLALADRALELGKPIMAVKVGSQRAGPGRGGRALRLARRRGAGHRCGARRGRASSAARDLDELLETAELVEGIRRTGPARRARADRASSPCRPARRRSSPTSRRGPASTCRRSRAARARAHPRGAADDGLHRQPARPVGRRRPGDGLRRRASRRWPRRAPTTCWSSSTTSRTARCRRRSRPPTTSPSSCSRRPRDRPSILPVYVSLTSGEPPPETKAVLDEQGGGAPLLRGAPRGVHARSPASPAGRRGATRRLADRPVAAGLAGARRGSHVSYGADPVAGPRRPRPRDAPCPSARASTLLRGGRDLRVDRCDRASPDAASRRRRPRGGSAGPVALKLDAVGLAHKSDLGGVRARPASATTRSTRPRSRSSTAGRAARPRRSAGCSSSRWPPPGIELIVGLRRDPQFGPVVLVGLGGILAEVLDDVAIRLAPVDAARRRCRCSTTCAAARLLDGVRGRPPIDRACRRGDARRARPARGRPARTSLEVDLNPVIASADRRDRRRCARGARRDLAMRQPDDGPSCCRRPRRRGASG